MKTLEEKIAEKKKTLNEINDTLQKSLGLYDTIISNYGALYNTNRGKTNSGHIAGIAQLLSKINDLFVTRNNIENEINGLLELENEQKTEVSPDKVQGSKDTILKLIEGQKQSKLN